MDIYVSWQQTFTFTLLSGLLFFLNDGRYNRRCVCVCVCVRNHCSIKGKKIKRSGLFIIAPSGAQSQTVQHPAYLTGP